MYKGFNLTLAKEKFYYFNNLVKEGSETYLLIKKAISDKIETFKNQDGTIDASKMQMDWFPRIPASIFLSHSHADEKLAIAFAAWVKKKFNLDVFNRFMLVGQFSDSLKIVR